MLDIKFLRTNPDVVKENIKKKFQDDKLPLVDKVIELDSEYRAAKGRADELRGLRNSVSKEIGGLMAQGKREEAEVAKQKVKDMADELAALQVKEGELEAERSGFKTLLSCCPPSGRSFNPSEPVAHL